MRESPGHRGSKLLTRVNVTLTDLGSVRIDAAPVRIECAGKCGTGFLNKLSSCRSAHSADKSAGSAEKISRGRTGHQTGERCKSDVAREPAA